MERLVSLTFLQTLAATELRLLESNMNTDTEHFDLRGQDEYSDEFAISIAINVARGFLQNHEVTARQIIGLGKALYVLERLPASTPRIAVEFGVVLRVNINLEEMRYIDFRISASVFQIARGGSAWVQAAIVTLSLAGGLKLAGSVKRNASSTALKRREPSFWLSVPKSLYTMSLMSLGND